MRNNNRRLHAKNIRIREISNRPIKMRPLQKGIQFGRSYAQNNDPLWTYFLPGMSLDFPQGIQSQMSIVS